MSKHQQGRNEKRLNVYAAGPRSLMTQLVAAFEADTGIPVNLVQAPTGRIIARLEAEADHPRADVFVSASWDMAEDLDDRGWLLPYQSPYATTIPDAFKTTTCVAHALSALAIVWNTESGTPEPKDWSDLATPEFERRLTMPDPRLSGTCLDLVSGLAEALGEEAWNLFKGLLRNGIEIAGSNDHALAPVLRGEKAAVFGSVDHVAYGALARRARIRVIIPRSGTVLVPRPVMILRSSRQPDRASAFIDYLLSDTAQHAAADAWLMPSRPEVPAKHRPRTVIDPLPHRIGSARREHIIARFGAVCASV